jgi:hypothetical protein
MMDAKSEELVDGDNMIDIDVLSIALEAHTEALTMPESEHNDPLHQ